MLWKLADNVKYEEDCEVRARGEGSPLGKGGPARGARGSAAPGPRCAPAPLAPSAAASPPGAAAGPARRAPLCFILFPLEVRIFSIFFFFFF
uniref:Uncharacterized protein n=1 Tax=Malurus cyaneus samueli TaxID=2593467 RepID=A0A8C5TWU9_9PASS